ncbi:MAG TPA: hypothetical protein VM328_05675 [Fimbriimonadaceae bacterium]|nr:hypothetical protein [Fimbriimonadaceae bacterium]
MSYDRAARFAQIVVEEHCDEREFDLVFQSERELDVVSQAIVAAGHQVVRYEHDLRIRVICK